jgi:tRNA pseudouridine38-40 synthase
MAAGMIYRLTLSYRGTAYGGWQRQDNARTVQQVLEEALGDLLGILPPPRLTGASRTDAGVHARGQVAHLLLPRPFPPRGLVHGTNSRLPDDVRVMAAREAPDGFDARRCAAAKEYRYRLSRAPVLSPLDALFVVQVPPRLALAPMAEAARHLPGRHDFSAFALAGGSHHDPHRTILAADWTETGDELLFTITGTGFLRGMVRSLVGTLIEVGLGKRPPSAFAALLTGAPRSTAGPTAPAHGLTLERVLYPPEWDA